MKPAVLGVAIVIVIGAIINLGCSDAPAGPSHVPTSPTPPLVPNANYSGEWAGGWRVMSCTDLPPRPGYCRNNVRPDFEPVRLYLTQFGTNVTGRMQARIGDGPVTGRVDELGRLRLEGTLPSVPGRVPYTQITDWRMVTNQDSGALIGGFTIQHLWGDDLSPAAVTVNEAEIPRCAGPKFSGFFWEC